MTIKNITATTANNVKGSITDAFTSSNPISAELASTKPDKQLRNNATTTLI